MIYLPPGGYRIPNQPFPSNTGYDLNSFSLPALIGKMRGSLPGGSRIGLRLIATRARVGDAFSATVQPQMVRTAMFARDDISKMKLCWANWYGNFRDPGGPRTVTASVEYPAGVFTQILFNGSASGTAPALTNLWSDFVSIIIPNGAQFWIRSFQSGVGLLLPDGSGSAALGDLISYPGTDQTMGGSITANPQSWSAPPSAVIGFSNKRCAFLIGDSITSGVNGGSSNLLGHTENGLGSNYALSRNSRAALKASEYLASFAAPQLDIAQYATDVVNAFGINDIGSGVSAAALQAIQSNIRALFPKLRYHVSTLIPSTTSTDNWATLINQTPFVQDAQRIAYNTTVRANSLGFDPFFECASVLESSLNSGKTKVDGTPFKYTSDGTHPSPFGYNSFGAAGFTL